MLNLLALDPDNGTVKTWEALLPTPPPRLRPTTPIHVSRRLTRGSISGIVSHRNLQPYTSSPVRFPRS